jgi:hypothetical protein
MQCILRAAHPSLSLAGGKSNLCVGSRQTLQSLQRTLCRCGAVSHFLLKQSAHFSIMVISNSKPRALRGKQPLRSRLFLDKELFRAFSLGNVSRRASRALARSRSSGFAFCFTQRRRFCFFGSCLFLFNETDTHPRRSKHNSDFKL